MTTKKTLTKTAAGNRRQGAMLVMAAVLLLFFLGMVACAFDLGWIVMTRTELQAAVDSSSLAGGTELLDGLGRFATKTPAEVEAAARPVAVEYAGHNRNGGIPQSYADPNRDVRFGWAVFDSNTNTWTKNWGQTGPDTGYNMIGVTLHRDQPASANADTELPLFIGPVLGRSVQALTANATAVILPASGFRIVPGDPTTADILPFAMSEYQYYKYLAAQAYYAVGEMPNPAGGLPNPIDPAEPGGDPDAWYTPPSGEEGDLGDPLFGHYKVENNGDVTFVQDFNDLYRVDEQDEEISTFSPGTDGYLEVDLYPRDDATAGNFGTIDIGNHNNSTQELSRQIETGVSSDDLAYLPNNSIEMPMTANGDTGVSAGIKAALETILGKCRAVALFSGVTNPGNNASYDLTEWVGMRLVRVELTGSLDYKNLTFQMCSFSAAGSTGDPTDTIDKDTTVFTPLILIE